MDGTIKIFIERDMMHATALIEPSDGHELTKDYIMEELGKEDIKAGINHEVIMEMINNSYYHKHYLIAEGKHAEAGTEGYYEYFFDTESRGYAPEIREDDTVDYSIHRELVKVGDLLALYHPAKQGFFGYTIHANIIAPIPVKNKPSLRLIGVQKKGNCYYSLLNGEVSLTDYLLSVNETLTIDKDAGVATGNITFTGNVHVKGDVLTDVTIKADGNILIDGVVEAAHIESGGNIIIRDGIHDKNNATIKAKGSVCAFFIKDAHVEAGENITFSHSYASELIARKSVIAQGKSGSIIGGTVFSGEEIIAKTTSNDTNIPTYLFITAHDRAISPLSKIVVSKHIFPGTQIRIGTISYHGLYEPSGEFHLVNGEILHYAINNFRLSAQIKAPTLSHSEKKHTILLVDDEPMLLKTFYSYLHEYYNVLAVTSAGDAFALMENTIPELILLDYMMPHMDGGQMLENMRKASWKGYTKIPVIFITAMTQKSIVKKCLSLYPQGYLLKPISRDELLNTLEHFFHNNKI